MSYKHSFLNAAVEGLTSEEGVESWGEDGIAFVQEVFTAVDNFVDLEPDTESDSDDAKDDFIAKAAATLQLNEAMKHFVSTASAVRNGANFDDNPMAMLQLISLAAEREGQSIEDYIEETGGEVREAA